MLETSVVLIDISIKQFPLPQVLIHWTLLAEDRIRSMLARGSPQDHNNGNDNQVSMRVNAFDVQMSSEISA